jgi:heavy metal sensor kinase
VRSVSARLTLRFMTISALILGLFSASLYLWVRESLAREADREISARSGMFLDRLTELAPGGRKALGPDAVQDLNRFLEMSGCTAEVRRADGTVLFAAREFSPARRGYRERVDRATDAEGTTLTVRLAISDQPFRRRLRELLLYFAIFCPIALGVAGLFGYLFVRQTFAPIEAVRRQAEQISRANVSDRIPEPGTTGELRDLVRTFNEMLDRLQRAILDLEHFAADAAHELRTPLATLRAEIETAVQHSRTPEEYERILASFHEEVVRMSRVVADLFTLAKLDMRQYALQRERVRLAPLLEEARETWEAMAAERGVEIRTEGGDAEVLGDPTALRRVLMNLVENAIKFNREGGRVTLGIERRNGRVRVQVSDTGIGIAASHLPRLFERFYRVDKARSRESGGAGLGLAICKSFIASHQGRIEVASEPGRGTVFTVELPSAGAERAPDPIIKNH